VNFIFNQYKNPKSGGLNKRNTKMTARKFKKKGTNKKKKKNRRGQASR
jgi:hypothetical protein